MAAAAAIYRYLELYGGAVHSCRSRSLKTMELWRTVAPGESLRRLLLVFSERVVTHAPIQTFDFDREGLLRRLDYRAPHADHVSITQVYSGHQRFSQAFPYRPCVDCQPSGPTRCRPANRRCWMSKSSASTLHRNALRYTRPRTPRQAASDGSKLGGHSPVPSRVSVCGQHIASESLQRHDGATTVAHKCLKRDTIAARRSTRQGTRLDLAHYRASTSPGVVKAGLSEATCRYTRRCRSRV